MDGNNSLKRFIRKDRGQDDLVFDSDDFLSREFVDNFGNEVKVRKKGQKGNKEVRYNYSGASVG